MGLSERDEMLDALRDEEYEPAVVGEDDIAIRDGYFLFHICKNPYKHPDAPDIPDESDFER